jgi:hypothetical protein
MLTSQKGESVFYPNKSQHWKASQRALRRERGASARSRGKTITIDNSLILANPNIGEKMMVNDGVQHRFTLHARMAACELS